MHRSLAVRKINQSVEQHVFGFFSSLTVSDPQLLRGPFQHQPNLLLLLLLPPLPLQLPHWWNLPQRDPALHRDLQPPASLWSCWRPEGWQASTEGRAPPWWGHTYKLTDTHLFTIYWTNWEEQSINIVISTLHVSPFTLLLSITHISWPAAPPSML